MPLSQPPLRRSTSRTECDLGFGARSNHHAKTACCYCVASAYYRSHSGQSPGRATFIIQATAPVKGLVTLDIGYNERTLQRHFIGYVERSTAANGVQQILACRELAAVLGNPLPLNLRHVDLQAVLAEISTKTSLRFRVPAQPYARVKAPFFYSLATGYLAMDSLASVFNIPDFIWQQQGDGEVFVGSWADSFFGTRAPLQLPTGLFDGYQGERITSVTLAGNQMAIKWKTQSGAA
jgi:hypothetical protein